MNMTLFAALTGPSAEPLVRDGDDALLPATSSAVARGDGVFETVLAQAGAPVDLAAHLARLELSARILDLAVPSAGAWRPVIEALVAAWRVRHPGEAHFVLRLTVTRETAFATAAPIPPKTLAQRAGISVITADDPFNRRAPYLTTVAKTLSYATNMAALRYAASKGADDIIFLGPDGTVTEAPTATVVIDSGGTLITPPQGPESGILPGITAARLNPTYRRITAQGLYAADAIYLVSAVRLAAPVVMLDGHPRAVDTSRHARMLQALAGPDSAGRVVAAGDGPPRSIRP